VLEKSILPLIPVNRLGEPTKSPRRGVPRRRRGRRHHGSSVSINGGQYMV